MQKLPAMSRAAAIGILFVASTGARVAGAQVAPAIPQLVVKANEGGTAIAMNNSPGAVITVINLPPKYRQPAIDDLNANYGAQFSKLAAAREETRKELEELKSRSARSGARESQFAAQLVALQNQLVTLDNSYAQLEQRFREETEKRMALSATLALYLPTLRDMQQKRDLEKALEAGKTLDALEVVRRARYDTRAEKAECRGLGDAFHPRLFGLIASDRPIGVGGHGGAGVGLDYCIPELSLVARYASLNFGLGSEGWAASAQIAKHQSFYMTVNVNPELWLRLGQRPSLIIGAGYVAPVFAYGGEVRKVRFPLVGAEANASIMITPKLGLQSEYELIYPHALYPKEGAVHALLFGIVLGTDLIKGIDHEHATLRETTAYRKSNAAEWARICAESQARGDKDGLFCDYPRQYDYIEQCMSRTPQTDDECLLEYLKAKKSGGLSPASGGATVPCVKEATAPCP